jgi:HPt (histidine-containing phosphotransfer) domain-containing protein
MAAQAQIHQKRGTIDLGPIDFAYLSRQCAGDCGLMEELLNMFARQAVEICGKMAAAPIASTALADLAHKLKGAAAAIGASQAAEAAQTLEAACRAGSASEAHSALAAVTKAVAMACAAVHAHFDRA